MFVASLEKTETKDTFYIPVIDSVAQYSFIFPDSIKENLYKISIGLSLNDMWFRRFKYQ